MIINILILLAFLALAFGFGWLVRRAWGAKNIFVKWAGSILSGLLAALLLFVSGLAVNGIYKFYTPKYNPAPELTVEGTPEQIARGRRLAIAFCVDCHSTTRTLPMTGGVNLSNDLPVNLGSFVSSNLTPAGPLRNYTDGEVFRALRESVDEEGGRLIFMAGTNVRYMSDEDMLAAIAYLRSQDAVVNETQDPPDRANFLALILFGANIFEERELVSGEIVAPEKAVTAEYGAFMMSFLDCNLCHGADLSGGNDPFAVNGPTLRHVKGWTEEQFIESMRTGVTPNGHQMQPPMPWEATGRLDDVELGAIYQYIISLK